MLGHKLIQVLDDRFDVWATLRTDYKKYEDFGIFKSDKTIENLNIEKIKTVEKIIADLKPEVIVNAVGIIKQLPSAKNVIKTLTTNSIFPQQLSEISNNLGARLITISTDCVYSGKKGGYVETDVSDCEDLYGKSKYLGEVVTENCLTVRTSIIGRELNTSHSLIEWFLSNGGKTVKGFTRAVYSGFPTLIFAQIIGDLIENHPKLQGLFHISSDPINKYDLLKLVKKSYGVDIKIEPFDDFEIDRSLDSNRFRVATGFKPLDWREMVERMAADNAIYKNKK